MNKMIAAHRTMAFGTIVKVTNLTNGKTAVVRITDRGPFIENRIIDLSMAAAKAIESIGPGVVPVRLEVISGSDPFGGFFTVQVGASARAFGRAVSAFDNSASSVGPGNVLSRARRESFRRTGGAEVRRRIEGQGRISHHGHPPG
jgi:rare lipoprotein A